MIALLQKEINIVPGQRMPLRGPESDIGDNCAVLQIINNSDYENAYTVRVDCDHPYWQQQWVRLASLVNMDDEGSRNQPAKQTIRLNDGSLRVFVPRRSQARILIGFELRRAPDSRAGRYPLQIKVTMHVRADQPGAADGAVERLQIDAYVEPYYDWEAYLDPDQRKVGFLRRRVSFNMAVLNRSNDWLYCTLRPQGQNNDIRLSAPTELLAVPPPALGEDESLRTVPLTAATGIRTLRGIETLQPIALQARRVDAPSVPQLPQQDHPDVLVERPDSVLAEQTMEVPTIVPDSGQPGLVYCPPVRSFVTGFLSTIINNFKTIVYGVMGLAALLCVYSLAMQVFFQDMRVEPLVGTVSAKSKIVPFKGRYIEGAKVFVYTTNPGNSVRSIPHEQPELLKQKSGSGGDVDEMRVPATARAVISRLNVTAPQVMHVDLTEVWGRLKPKDVVRFDIQRASFFAKIFPKLLTYQCDTEVSVDKKAAPVRKSDAKVSGFASGAKTAGDAVVITGTGFGTERGQIQVAGMPAGIDDWTDTSIAFIVPDSPGRQKKVRVRVHGQGGMVYAGSIDIAEAEADQPAPNGGGGGRSAGGGGGGENPVPTPRPAPTRPSRVSQPRPPRTTTVRMLPPRVSSSPAYDLLTSIAKQEANTDRLQEVQALAGNDAEGKAIRAIALFQQATITENSADEAKAEKLAGEAMKSARTARARSLAYLANGYSATPSTNWKKAIDTDRSCELAKILWDNYRKQW